MPVIIRRGEMNVHAVTLPKIKMLIEGRDIMKYDLQSIQVQVSCIV
jgi:hypothetical protein